jgi:hypothetical protein
MTDCQACKGSGMHHTHVAHIVASGLCLHCHGTGIEGGQYGQQRTLEAIAFIADFDAHKAAEQAVQA